MIHKSRMKVLRLSVCILRGHMKSFSSIIFVYYELYYLHNTGFLEDINNILSSGVVPNLFTKDELPVIYDSVRRPMISSNLGLDDTSTNVWKFFIDRVRNNLHVVLAMSPVGDGLRNRCRMYPGLVNCTTIG